ncbi:hypothetical protein BGZ96_004850 [Linnemannia gamsii]|uniref:HCP-like protein n=1 Tax=Linnemannia gamsii TaxID=64522 RepID=A0ABQ7K6T3_9FUNG|nr:hypothetical protein BGZ96_004850 [Linnemannia gamsii]
MRSLDPPRVAAIPGVTLDVVVIGPTVNASPSPSALNQIAQQAAQFPKYSPFSALQSHPWTPTSHFTTGNNILRTFNLHRAPVALTSTRQLNDTTARAHKRVLDLNKVKTVIGKMAVCIDLDTLHAKGDGCPQDFRKALECYLKTVQKGQTQALISVGDLFLDGQAVQQSPTIAMGWYLKAAYLTQECLTALDRHRKAADQGDSTAQRNVGVLYFAAQEYSQAMTWCRKAVEQGDAAAKVIIGNLYELGCGVSQDHAEAMIWYRKAAEQEDATAQYSIGYLYYQGCGVSQDHAKAMIWYRKAAEKETPKLSRGASQDYVEAMSWYRKAAEQGDAKAQYNIGMMYYHGRGVSQDHAEAVTWYRKAAEQGVAAAQFYIGQMV